MPLQGGHNEAVAHALYTDPEDEFHDGLDAYYFVRCGPDETGASRSEAEGAVMSR